MKLYTHLSFNGECEAAFKFYAKVFKGKITTMMRVAGSPMEKDSTPAWKKKILHATLDIAGQTLGAGDTPPEYYKKPEGTWVTLDVKKPAEADRLYKLLSKGGKLRLPMQETFWAQRFAMFNDRFGTPWMINCGKPM